MLIFVNSLFSATNTGAEVDVQTSGVRKRTPRHRSKKPSPYRCVFVITYKI